MRNQMRNKKTKKERKQLKINHLRSLNVPGAGVEPARV